MTPSQIWMEQGDFLKSEWEGRVCPVTELIFARFKNAFLPECCMLASQQRALLYSLRQLLQPAVSTPSLNLPVLSP